MLLPVHLRVAPVLAFALSLAIGFGQTYPGQYPRGQYPPGQYPPGQYPPGQYPPGQYPLPGGVPVGIPVPEIKLPRRDKPDEKKQDRKGELTISLGTIDGTLRQMSERDLILETRKGLLRFRLLVKTEFRDKKGEPVRDSLLKPGDQLQVEVNQDDEETALFVTFVRAGTPAEREAAARPVDPSAVKVPAGLEASKRRIPSEPQRGADPDDSAIDAEPPVLRRRPDLSKPETESAGATPAGAPPAAEPPGSLEGRVAVGNESVLFNKVDDVIAAAREAADTFSDGLPNFVVQQLTTRYISNSFPAQWRAMDIVEAEVAVANGTEEYRNMRINGRASNRPPEKSGAWSTGEFVTTLQDVLSPQTDAQFMKRGENRIANRTAYLYDFTVRQRNSNWRIIPEHGEAYQPGYAGSIWIDKETHRVLRIEKRSLSIPSNFPFDKVEGTLDYDFVRLEGKLHLLPVRSENLLCQRGSANCSRNEIEFRNYRKFEAESNIKFESKYAEARSEPDWPSVP